MYSFKFFIDLPSMHQVLGRLRLKLNWYVNVNVKMEHLIIIPPNVQSKEHTNVVSAIVMMKDLEIFVSVIKKLKLMIVCVSK